MTVARLEAVGYCAHYSRQGDWAFDFAFDLCRRQALQLNVFHFMVDPFDAGDRTGQDLDRVQRARLAVDLERELRFYYEPKLGDWVDVGFRLCADPEWTELHRCLTRREFQLLVLPWPAEDARFAGKPIDEFAEAFVCPVVLVGPSSAREIHVNRPARLECDRYGLGAAVRAADAPPVEAAPDLVVSSVPVH
jgi:hypothetical protein